MKKLITTECVSYGHPDKIADQISDALLDAYIIEDKNSKVAIETMVKDNVVVLGGEVMSNGHIDIEKVVKQVVKEIGFTKEQGFYYEDINIINLIGKQSIQINKAVVQENEEVGAGDQGFMVGFATNEAPNYMPIGMYIARILAEHFVINPHFGPDLKTQVTVEEDTETGVKRIHSILVSTMQKNIFLDEAKRCITQQIKENDIKLSKEIFSLIDEDTNIFVNPAGKWTIGGPVADCGVTGRKIVVDQYGPYCPVGGGAMSGKDFSKVDRSGAYLCRYIAKNIVASGFGNDCKVEIAYMIGVAEPVSINIEIEGKPAEQNLVDLIKEIFPMTPKQIIEHFDLRKPIYLETAKHGHFGINSNSRSWEKLDMIEKLKQ